MEQKTYGGQLEFKAGEMGEFVARFATLNVVDHDRDVTETGAFPDGQETLIEAWNHNYGQLPVGKATIREEDDVARVEGAFFLDTQGGLEHYKTVKNLGELQEWSYTFRILEAGFGEFEGQQVRFLKKLDVISVAPVDRGAGINTGTLAVKDGRDGAKARETVQAMHDLTVKLGAKCSGDDEGGESEGDGQEGDGKAATSRTQEPSTLAGLAALELLKLGFSYE